MNVLQGLQANWFISATTTLTLIIISPSNFLEASQTCNITKNIMEKKLIRILWKKKVENKSIKLTIETNG